MARYPKAFEIWYRGQVQMRGQEFDDIIIRMRDQKEVKTLAEGERHLRKMLFMEWKLEQPSETRSARLGFTPDGTPMDVDR